MAKRKESIAQRAARRTAEAKARGRARRELATRVGTFILNEVEHGGQCSIEDYSIITPKWLISYYLGVRRRA
jgi:hypothetical protein